MGGWVAKTPILDEFCITDFRCFQVDFTITVDVILLYESPVSFLHSYVAYKCIGVWGKLHKFALKYSFH